MKTIVFLATAAISFSAFAATFETYLGSYSVEKVACYVDGVPQTASCSADVVILEKAHHALCLKVAGAETLSGSVCMSEYRSDNRTDHTPNNFHEAYFSSDEHSVSWIKNIAAGSYRSSHVVTLTSQGSDLILNVSFREIREGKAQSRSAFYWLSPRVHTLPVEVPGR